MLSPNKGPDILAIQVWPEWLFKNVEMLIINGTLDIMNMSKMFNF